MNLLSIRDVQDRLSCSRASVYRMIKNNNFPSSLNIKNLGARWRDVDVDVDVDDWIASQYEMHETKKGA